MLVPQGLCGGQYYLPAGLGNAGRVTNAGIFVALRGAGKDLNPAACHGDTG